MIPDITTPIMLTMAVLIGLLLVSILLQILHHVRLVRLEQDIKDQLELIYTDNVFSENFHQQINLEDLIKRDLEEQMVEVNAEFPEGVTDYDGSK